MDLLDSSLAESLLDGGNQEIFGNNASKVKLFSVILDGIVTDFAVSDYINQVFIVVTQFQKIGTLISVTKGLTKTLKGCEAIYDVTTICGLDSTEYQLAARFLASQLDVAKPILFGMSLKDCKPKTLKALAKVIKENIE